PGIAGCLAPDEPIRIVRKCQQRVLVCDRVASNGTSHVRTRVLSQPRQYSNRRAVMSGDVFTDSVIGTVRKTFQSLSTRTIVSGDGSAYVRVPKSTLRQTVERFFNYLSRQHYVCSPAERGEHVLQLSIGAAYQ